MKALIETLPPEQADRVVAAFGEANRTVLPIGWRCSEAADNAAVFLGPRGLSVIVEMELHGEDLWLHVSASKNRGQEIPNWTELRLIKDLFVGRERKAIQVLPSEAEHFSMFEVLHLFAPWDRDPLPDFRRTDGGL